MAAPIINPLPPAPLTTDSGDVFDSKAFVFVGALEPFRQQLQSQADFVNLKVVDLATAVNASEASAVRSEQARDASAAKAIESSESADRAEAAASEASGSAADAAAAKTYRNEAQQARDDAVAVVTGGEAALEPTPGKIPLADAEGKIDLRWLGADAAARILMSSVRVNDIGAPGAMGFGQGICPELPAGYSLMPGTLSLGSDEYGNYQYSDGSVMVWIPAFFARIGHGDNPTYDEYSVNSMHAVPFSAYPSVAAAEADGYFLPRAFIDGGEIVAGFMYDKYQASNNGGTASSIKNGDPLSNSGSHNPFSGLTGSPANNLGGIFDSAKTRGSDFFPASRFMRGALAILSMAHGQASESERHCAWFSAGGSNYPKGNNNNALGDTDDSSVSYTSDGYQNAGKTGSGVPFAKTTHNGQPCGVADLNGNMWMAEIGFTCVASSETITGATQANPVVITVVGHGAETGDTVQISGVDGMTELNDKVFKVTVLDVDSLAMDGIDGSAYSAYASGGTAIVGRFYAAKESTKMADFTGGNSSATDHWGPTGVSAMMEPVDPGFTSGLGFTNRFGNGSDQVISSSGTRASLGFPGPGSVSGSGTNLFGRDYYRQYVQNELCVLSGGAWSNGSVAGVWAVSLYSYRTYSLNAYGFRAASYPVPRAIASGS